jgi:hypothetical protein
VSQSLPFKSAATTFTKIRVYRRMGRLSLSGWMRSVPYPFRSQMAKVELRETV